MTTALLLLSFLGVAGLLLYMRGRIAGARLEREKRNREIADEVDQAVGDMPSTEALKELRKWRRPD